MLGSEAVVAVGPLESLLELDELAVGPELVGADDVVVGAGDDWTLPEDELELPEEEPLDEEPELPDECDPPELPDDEPELEPPSGLTYWLSPAEAPPPWARDTAGAARASVPSTPMQTRNWRHAVIR